MVDVTPTKDNRVLSSAVNARIRSDARLHNAKAALWQLVGFGVMSALIGVGIGAAFYGYSHIADPTVPAELIARSVARGLEGMTLKTEGVVKLDPDSKVQVAGAPADLPRPSAQQLGADAAPASRAPVATNYTVFKNVPFGQGQVVTGWNFGSSEESMPKHQYCYYSEQIDGTSKVTLDLGENGRSVAMAKTRVSVDPAAAYGNCVWFKSPA